MSATNSGSGEVDRLPVQQRLDRARDSLTAPLLSRDTRMLAIDDGTLQLGRPGRQRGVRVPIDFFPGSLAQSQSKKALATNVSGTGTEGTLGMGAVERVGGIALAQSPQAAPYECTPRSTIATGLVDCSGSPRKGLHPNNVATQGSAQRLPLFFKREADGSGKSNRDTVVLAISSWMSGFPTLQKPLAIGHPIAHQNRLLGSDHVGR